MSAFAQQNDPCSALVNAKVPGLEITKAAHVEAGTTEVIPWNQSRSAALPGYCRIEGVISRRSGVGGEEFGIAFVLAMPDKWNGDFLMQGGGGSNGIVLAPLGLNAAGDTPGRGNSGAHRHLWERRGFRFARVNEGKRRDPVCFFGRGEKLERYHPVLVKRPSFIHLPLDQGLSVEPPLVLKMRR